MSILKLGFRYAQRLIKLKKPAEVSLQTTAAVKNTLAAPVSKKVEPLFCEKYWAWAKENRLVKNSSKTSVDLHGELHSINHHFQISPYPEHMDIPAGRANLTPRQMITQTDLEFKGLTPTEKTVTAFRAVGEKPEFFSTYKLYEKATRVKPGDKFRMSEYSYFSSDINYANVYLTNNKGILYEIEFPEKSRISRIGTFGANDELVTPRASEFLCTNVERIKNAEADYLLVKGKYIQPKDILEELP